MANISTLCIHYLTRSKVRSIVRINHLEIQVTSVLSGKVSVVHRYQCQPTLFPAAMGQECCKHEPSDEDTRDEKDVVRFFMIGTGGAGKTTVVRQLKCLCKDSPKDYKAFNPNWGQIERDDIFSPTEMDQFKRRIQSNIIAALYNLTEQAHEWRYPISTAESCSRIRDIKEQAELDLVDGGEANMEYEQTLAEDIVALLHDDAVEKTLKRCHQMSAQNRLEDGTLHFLNDDDIRRIFDIDTQLTCQDIVHSRNPTTGIQDFRFGIKSMRLQIHDMGGQVSELVKLPEFIQQWIRGNEDGFKNFVLYVTSMSDFNLVDENNQDFTAMDKSVRTLDIILGMNIVSECGVMIFFNKEDRFDDMCIEMLKTEGGRNDIIKHLGAGMDNATKSKVQKGTVDLTALHEAVTNKFIKVVKPKRKGTGHKGVYMRYTKAVDPKMMSTLFDAIQNEIFNDIFSKASFIMV